MLHFRCDERLNFLSNEEKAKLNGIFIYEYQQIYADTLATKLGVELSKVYALVAILSSVEYCQVYLMFYHGCAENAVDSMPFGKGFPRLPWHCPNCKGVEQDYDKMQFNVKCVAKDAIKFI